MFKASAGIYSLCGALALTTTAFAGPMEDAMAARTAADNSAASADVAWDIAVWEGDTADGDQAFAWGMYALWSMEYGTSATIESALSNGDQELEEGNEDFSDGDTDMQNGDTYFAEGQEDFDAIPPRYLDAKENFIYAGAAYEFGGSDFDSAADNYVDAQEWYAQALALMN